MFATLFKHAEASVDNAIGDLGNRVLIAIPFLAALGFGAASLSFYLNRIYGPELGNLIVAGAFCALGVIIWLVVLMRRSAAEKVEQPSAATQENTDTVAQKSLFDDEALMSVLTSAAPIVLPATLRTAMKNWPILLALITAIFIFTRDTSNASESAKGPTS